MTENASDLRAVDSVVLSDEDQVLEILRQSVFGLWDVVNNLTRLTPTRRPEVRVSIFGSARVPRDHWVDAAVRDLARQLALMGCAVITGGGPGLMEAANEGAALAGVTASNVGIRVHLPFEQEVNPFVDESCEHLTFFSRLHHFVLASDAFVVVPGGIGTVLELSAIWQLLQVRKVRSETPLILIGNMWADFVAWARSYLLRPEFELTPLEDIELPRCVNTIDEAVAPLRPHYDESVHKSLK
jgi:hypothetical protein